MNQAFYSSQFLDFLSTVFSSVVAADANCKYYAALLNYLQQVAGRRIYLFDLLI
jgi:hypothetical protein